VFSLKLVAFSQKQKNQVFLKNLVFLFLCIVFKALMVVFCFYVWIKTIFQKTTEG